MGRKKKPVPAFKVGDKVTGSMLEPPFAVITDVNWNGLTYMYDFEGTNIRCGEGYLQRYKQ